MIFIVNLKLVPKNGNFDNKAILNDFKLKTIIKNSYFIKSKL